MKEASFEAEKYYEALPAFNNAIKLNPNEAEAYLYRGCTNEAIHSTEDALGDFFKAIELNPDYSEAYYNKGIVWFDYGTYNGCSGVN